MKKQENNMRANQDKGSGKFPIEFSIMLGTLGFGVIVIILKILEVV